MRKIAIALAALAGALVHTPPPLQALLIVMGLDLVSGILYAVKQRDLSSKVMYDGLLRKSAVLLIVLAVYVFDREYASAIKLEIANATVFAFTVREILSILENASRLGVPIPRWLQSRLRGYDIEQNKDLEGNDEKN